MARRIKINPVPISIDQSDGAGFTPVNTSGNADLVPLSQITHQFVNALSKFLNALSTFLIKGQSF
jgi:hypothetical protein